MPVPARRSATSSPQQMSRWDPFREFEQLQEEMGRLVQSVWSPAGTRLADGTWVCPRSANVRCSNRSETKCAAARMRGLSAGSAMCTSM